MNLCRAILFVKDLERMTAFYRDGMGLRETHHSRQDGWVDLAAGGTNLALHAIPDELAARIVVADPPEARQQTPIKLVFQASDVAAARAHLISHGAVMFEPRASGECDGLDPEGNVFQIAPR